MTRLLLDELDARGLIHQSTDRGSLAAWLAGGSRKVYAGFDPPADSLHVGSLLPLMLTAVALAWLARRKRQSAALGSV